MHRKPNEALLTHLCESRLNNHAISFWSIRDYAATSCTSRALFASSQEDSHWRFLYKRDFFSPIFAGEYRSQYIAQCLYQKATTSLRVDQRGYYWRQLSKFIRENDYHRKPWARFFLGWLHYVSDDFPDAKAGLYCLKQAVAFGDYRAAQFLAQEINFSNIENYELFEVVFDEIPTDFLKENLVKAYENRQAICVAPEIAYLCAFDENLTEAFDWLKKSFEQGVKININFLKAIIKLFSSEENPYSEEALQIVDCMKCSFDICPSGDLAFQIGHLYFENRDWDPTFDLSKEWFERAVAYKHGEAASNLGNIYLNGNGSVAKCRKTAVDLFCKSVEYGCPDGAWHKIINGEGSEAEFKTMHRLGNELGACQLDVRYRKEEKWHQNPQKVTWVQAAAQCGYKGPMDAFTHLPREDNTPYARCAFALIFSLGFLPLPTLTMPIEEFAKQFIADVKPTELEHYRNVLKTEGLLEPYMDSLLETWIKSVTPKSEMKLSA